MNREAAKAPAVLWCASLLGAAFLFYFAVLLHSECGLPGRSWANLEKKRFVQAGVLVAAILFMASRPRDRRAQIGALLLAVAGTAPAFPHEDMRAVWRSLPLFLGAVLWIPQLLHFMALPVFFTFHALWPRPFFRRPSLWILPWIPAIVLSGWAILGLFKRIYHPETTAPDVPRWYLFAVGLFILLYGFGGLAVLLASYLRSSEARARQMRVLTFGAIGGWSPGLLFLAAIFLAPFTDSSLIWALVLPPFKHIALAMFGLVPISLVYALLRDHALDLS